MVELINRASLLENAEKLQKTLTKPLVFKQLEKLINAEPTVDAVPVVRCRDCYVSHPYTCGSVYCVHHGMSKQPDEFCSYGYPWDGD